MKTFYQMSGEDTMKQLNGSAEPLTESQVKEHQEKYGRNELVEGKKKTVLQIFLEQYKDFLVIILIIAAIASGFMGDVESTAVILIVITMNTGNSSDCESRTISCQPEKTFRSGSKSAEKRNSYPDSVFGSNSR